MSKQPFSTDANYIRSIRGLHELHALAIAGNDDGPEAEATRDSLEQPWTRLSEVEKNRLTGLSEDLYSLSEPTRKPLPITAESQRNLDDVSQARQVGDWDRALELLRRCGPYLEPAMLSYLRGSIWMEAEDFATAALFFERAARLDPDNSSFASLHLYSLAQSDPPAARTHAAKVLATTTPLVSESVR